MIKTKMFHPSLERLRELANPSADGSPEDMASSSREFSRIHQNLQLRGIWKWTGRHRLEQMDRLLLEHASARGLPQCLVLDLGASDGITSLDTVEYFEQKGGKAVRVTMLDQDVRIYGMPVRYATLYFTASRCPLLLRLGKIGLCLEPMEGIEGVLFNPVAAFLARRCKRLLESSELEGAHAISLINPAVTRCPRIDVSEGDMFSLRTEWVGQFDAVRASNVLNFSYYSEERIRDAIGLAHRYLKEGGAFLVSRNTIRKQDEVEAGALWRKQGNRFVRKSELDNVPEIAGLVDRFVSSLDCVPATAQP